MKIQHHRKWLHARLVCPEVTQWPTYAQHTEAKETYTLKEEKGLQQLAVT